jgi:two-component system nitrate/nitrite response regulator NarL
MVECRAVLVIENRLLRDGLKEMMQKSRISVIGEAPDLSEIVAAMPMRPDTELVVCHIAADQSPETGLDLVYGLRRSFPQAKLVVLADACTRSLLSSFVGADVNAILLTSISSEMLQRSLDLVMFDHRLFPAEIMALISDTALAKLPVHPAPVGRAIMAETGISAGRVYEHQAALRGTGSPSQSGPVLSRREHQIIDCLVGGLPNKSIARELNITEATVKVYVKGLLRKIKVSNRTQVAIWALQQSHSPDADKSEPALEKLAAPAELNGQTPSPVALSG